MAFGTPRFLWILLWSMAAVVLLGACTREPAEEKLLPPGLEPLETREVPAFIDDLDRGSLEEALRRSLEYYERLPGNRILECGGLKIPAGRLKATVALFLELLAAGDLDREKLLEHFQVLAYRSREELETILVTGYYEPVIESRRHRDEVFRHPLYALPPDLVQVRLELFDPERFNNVRPLVGRLNGRYLVPYPTRSEIDWAGALSDCQCELAWLKDPVEAFFLHVQGSGMLVFPDGSRRRIGYAGSNGHPYRSIGKYLIETGSVPSDVMSLQAIRDFLHEHPERIQEVLSVNPGYVFFRWVDEGPLGSLSVPLTAGRSAALDPACYPKGIVGFLETEQPVLDDSGEVKGWAPLRRWVVSQDTGGAINGPERLDLFFGSGEEAGRRAGRMKQSGKLVILLKK